VKNILSTRRRTFHCKLGVFECVDEGYEELYEFCCLSLSDSGVKGQQLHDAVPSDEE
jgi:hypothetical protein